MLTELCEYLKNWFNTDMPKRYGSFTVANGKVEGLEDMLTNGQYFRIVGSLFNDGVYKYGDEKGLEDETFNGAIWAMAVPKRAVTLARDIEDWQAKYGGNDSENMSPYTSESFAGYSYSKSSGGSSDTDFGDGSWQKQFKSRLARWRKI